MAALPEDFLKTLIAEVATLKNLRDAQQNVRETDSLVTTCAKVAYVQVCDACNRPFHWGARIEIYEEYVGPLLLRSAPIDLTKPIRVTVDGEEVRQDELRIWRNRLVLYNDRVEDVGRPRYKDIEFTFSGGIKTLEENNKLYTACVLQTIANYHRRDTYGLSETSGEKGVARTPADSGEIIESARVLLDKLIYNGIGYSLDGE